MRYNINIYMLKGKKFDASALLLQRYIIEKPNANFLCHFCKKL